MNLFENITLPEITKIAMDVPLSSSADKWTAEVFQELTEQHPYLVSYDVMPNLENVDGERGYGMGTIIVRNQHAMPDIGPGMQETMRQDGVKVLRIPILIEDNKLKPMDVVLDQDGKAYPLNDRRVRELLYRPELFDTSTRKTERMPYDKLFLPALRGAGGYTKTSSEKEFVLEAVADTVDMRAIGEVADQLREDATLAKAAGLDPLVAPFLEFIDALDPVTPEMVTKVAGSMIAPDVVQLVRREDDYVIKVASTKSFAPLFVVTDLPTTVEALDQMGLPGAEVVKEANENGVVTMVAEPTVDRVLEEEPGEDVTRFGEWRVKGQDGVERVGWVFPEVRALNGARLPLKIFNNGDACSMQDTIIGSYVGHGVNITRGPIQGQGMFYRITDKGSVIGFEPVEVVERALEGDRMVFRVTPISDPVTPITVKTVPGLKMIQPLDAEGTSFALPEDIRWMPLGRDIVPLVTNPDVFAKVGSADVVISGIKDAWTFEGRALDKIAGVLNTRTLDAADSMFLASCLGMSPDVAFHHLNKVANHRGPTKVSGCRLCVLPEERTHMAKIAANVKTSGLDIPRQRCMLPEVLHLSKIAKMDNDTDTIDRVLSLNFLNPTNMRTFITYLPDFDTTVKKLAGLLLAVRFGQQDIDEAAVKNAMEAMEDVIGGLRKFVHRQTDTEA